MGSFFIKVDMKYFSKVPFYVFIFIKNSAEIESTSSCLSTLPTKRIVVCLRITEKLTLRSVNHHPFALIQKYIKASSL